MFYGFRVVMVMSKVVPTPAGTVTKTHFHSTGTETKHVLTGSRSFANKLTVITCVSQRESQSRMRTSNGMLCTTPTKCQATVL